MNITVAPMKTEAEVAGKAYVHWKSWQETYAGLIDPQYLAEFTLEKCQRIATRWGDHLLVAKDGERVVGFVGYGAYRDDTLAETGEVYSIYVLREYHGRQVGRALMDAALKKLATYPRVAVWVLKGNERAIRFYQKVGFVFDGTEAEILLGTPNTELRMIRKNNCSCGA